MIARVFSLLAGACILAAVAHGTASHGADVTITWAMAFAVFVGSVLAGRAFSNGHWLIGMAILACGLAGEAYNLLKTGDRLIAEIDRAQAPRREGAAAHAQARKIVRDLEATVARPVETSKRLADANASKTAADAAVTSKSAEKGCKTECRHLLQKAVDDAAAEVKAARAAIDATNEKTRKDLDDARKRLSALAPPVSESPLADQLGMSPRALMLLTTGLGAFSINGLAMFLLIYGSHNRESGPRTPRVLDRLWRWRKAETAAQEPQEAPPERAPPPVGRMALPKASNVVRLPPPPKPAPKIDPKPVIAYMAAHVPEAHGEKAEWGDIYRGFQRWCAEQSPPVAAYSGRDFGMILSAICEKADIRVLNKGSKVFCVNRKVK